MKSNKKKDYKKGRYINIFSRNLVANTNDFWTTFKPPSSYLISSLKENK